MKVNFGGKSLQRMATSPKDLKGFKSYNRFIVISEITSDTIENILDVFYSLLPFSTEYVSPATPRCRVMVINNSEVYGSYKGQVDTRTRNVYIHYGVAECSANQLTHHTPIFFTDVDWNVISDKPFSTDRRRTILGGVRVSYDKRLTDGKLYRDESTYEEILIPTPEFYDEKDMVLIGDRDYSYSEELDYKKESLYFDPPVPGFMFDACYMSTLNDLIDDNTKIYKLNIKIDKIRSNIDFEKDDFMDDMIHYVCSQTKYALEQNGFSRGEVIYNGENGYNVTGLKTYLKLDPVEASLNYSILCHSLDEINMSSGITADYSVMLTLSHENVHVAIVDRKLFIDDKTKTDTNVLALSEELHMTTDNYMVY